MGIKRRIILCVSSSLIALSGAGLLGVGQSAAKLLHVWYGGVLVPFVIFFTILMGIVLRSNLEKSLWAIPVSAALSYPAASLAYLTYFVSFEPQRFFNTLNQLQLTTSTFAPLQLLDAIVVILFVVPTASLAWLFGIFAGATFLLLAHLR